jgi:hypothetical integral membrane protein (TIGR02206 family)
MPHRFVVFSFHHGMAVAVGLVIVALLLISARRSSTARPLVRTILAFFTLTAYGYSQYAWSQVDHLLTWENILPFHLCDITAFLAAYALMKGRPWAQELTYYWGLAATVQAIITPALQHDFPHITFFSFFLHHFAIIGAALFIPLCDGWRPASPWWHSPLRAFAWINGYLIFAFVVNQALDTNFGFVAHAPTNPSLIDHLGPWPLYLIAFQIIAMCLFILLTWAISRKK